MITSLLSMRDGSQHATLLIEGLRSITTLEARDNLRALHRIIADCEVKGMKRLEVEVRLIQACYHILLRNLGTQSDLAVGPSLQNALDLCKQYPDTAGSFLRIYQFIKTIAIDGRQVRSTIYNRDLQVLWWSWPKHKIGNVKYCDNRHPYSGATSPNCPECGRETPKPEKIDPMTFLKEGDFIVAMRSVSLEEKCWRV